jgi:hypothetical protein
VTISAAGARLDGSEHHDIDLDLAPVGRIASVSSSAGKYSPPVTEVSASSRKLFPWRRRPLTTPSNAP